MSMNLFGAFYDSKNRQVAKLSFRQTPTKLSYQIVPAKIEKFELTRDNFEKVLAPYFDPVNGMVSKPYSTGKEKIESIKKERLAHYDAFKKAGSYSEEYCREVSCIDRPLPELKTIFGRYWESEDEWHIEELLETFNEYIDDYKCLIFVM